MRAMIFAAGLGSRLKPITDTRPKALVTVGGKTMLEHIILKLKASGFNDIVINTHHFANQILAFLEANQNFGVNIEISDETNCLLDTGGGLEKASHLLYHPENMFTQKGETPYELIFENLNKGMDEDEIIEKALGVMRKECYLLHNVDILSNCDLESLMYYHQNSLDVSATLLVSQRKTSRYLLFDEEDLLCGWINKDTMETKPTGLRYEEFCISFQKANIPLSISISLYATESTSSAMSKMICNCLISANRKVWRKRTNFSVSYKQTGKNYKKGTRMMWKLGAFSK